MTDENNTQLRAPPSTRRRLNDEDDVGNNDNATTPNNTTTDNNTGNTPTGTASPPRQFVFDFGPNAPVIGPPVFRFGNSNNNNDADNSSNGHENNSDDTTQDDTHNDIHVNNPAFRDTIGNLAAAIAMIAEAEAEDSSSSDGSTSMPPLEDINNNVVNNNNDEDNDENEEESNNNVEEEDDSSSNNSMPPLADRDDSSESTTNTNPSESDDNDSMPPLYNRFDALETSSSSSSSGSDDDSESMPSLMNRNGTNDDSSDSDEEEDGAPQALPPAPRFEMGNNNNNRNNNNNNGRNNRNRRGGRRPQRDRQARWNNNNNDNQENENNNNLPFGRGVDPPAPHANVANGNRQEEEEEEDSIVTDADEDDNVVIMDDEDEDDEEDEQNNDNNGGNNNDNEAGVPPGFRRFMEDMNMAGFNIRGGRVGGGGGGGGGGGPPPGFPPFFMGRGGDNNNDDDDDDGFPPFIPPFLRNMMNMNDEEGRRGNDRNEGQRRVNTVYKRAGDDSDEECTDSDLDSFDDGICNGVVSRCAACFRSDDPNDSWRRLVTLPCCGTNGKEESSSTRFCAACMLRMATTVRSDEPGAAGEYERWDDARYEYPARKFYTKDNLETESRKFVECPRCRNLLMVKLKGLKLIPNDEDDSDDNGCDCSECVAERLERRANRPKTKSVASITISQPSFKLKSWYIGRKKGIAKLLWKLLFLNHGLINLDALGGEEQEANVLKLITWGVLKRVPGKKNHNIYCMDKKEQALLAPLFKLPKKPSEKDTDRERELYVSTMMDTAYASFRFLKVFRVDRSLRMLNQVGIQLMSCAGQLPRLPLSQSQTIVVTVLNIYLISLVLQLSVILLGYLFFFFAVGAGVCYGIRRSSKSKLQWWKQGCIDLLCLYGSGRVVYTIARRLSSAFMYRFVFPRAASVLKWIHRPFARMCNASVDYCADFLLPKVGSVLQHPGMFLVAPCALVGLYGGVKKFVGGA